MVLSLATSTGLTRALQPEGRGLYAMVLVFASILTYYSTFGIEQSATIFSDSVSTLFFPRLSVEKGAGVAIKPIPIVLRIGLFSRMGMGGLLIGLSGGLITLFYGEAYVPSVLHCGSL